MVKNGEFCLIGREVARLLRSRVPAWLHHLSTPSPWRSLSLRFICFLSVSFDCAYVWRPSGRLLGFFSSRRMFVILAWTKRWLPLRLAAALLRNPPALGDAVSHLFNLPVLRHAGRAGAFVYGGDRQVRLFSAKKKQKKEKLGRRRKK